MAMLVCATLLVRLLLQRHWALVMHCAELIGLNRYECEDALERLNGALAEAAADAARRLTGGSFGGGFSRGFGGGGGGRRHVSAFEQRMRALDLPAGGGVQTRRRRLVSDEKIVSESMSLLQELSNK